MRVLLYLFLISFLPLQLAAQTTSPFAQVDQKVLQMPAQEMQTIDQLSAYINQNFQTPQERVRAAYMWLAHHVAYDVAALSSSPAIKKGYNFIAQTLKTRKAVCQGYAETFQELCNRAGVKTYFIGGYTKQLGRVDFIPHSWCAAQLNGQWYLFDPTWGAGYVEGNRFVKKLNEKFFMVSPANMVASHYPFDPLWQFSTSPIKSKQFNQGLSASPNRQAPFQFADTLKTYEAADEHQRIASTARRMEAHGIDHPFLANHFQYLNRSVEINRYNAISDTYNQGIDLLNQYIYLKNKKLLATKGETELREMLSTSVETLQEAKHQMAGSRWQNDPKGVAAFLKNIDLALKQALSEEVYLDNFFKSAKVR